jgi:hypothetical protein
MDEPNNIVQFATLDIAAVSMHELFESLQRAGFDETQALKLVIGLSRD